MGIEVVDPADDGLYPDKGDWVLVWGQIEEGNTHPDDVLVRFHSHNSDYVGHVEVKRIRVPADGAAPEFAIRCTHLGRTTKKGRHYLLQCCGHHGHGGNHSARDIIWADAETVGYFEEK